MTKKNKGNQSPQVIRSTDNRQWKTT